MKKSGKKILIVVLCFVVVAASVGGVVGYKLSYHQSKWFTESDNSVEELPFEESVAAVTGMMSNTWETGYPQTAIYDIVKAHFASPLPEGKTEKKAIVIGYDGCRIDTFRLLETSKRSAIKTLLDEGGEAAFSYCGGVNYPAENIQATSTAPGWCTMLTGVLSDVHKITKNGVPKEIEPKTLILDLAESGTVEKTAFYVSWAGHFSKKTATYYPEKVYAAENGINAVYKRAHSDSGTRKNVLRDLNSADCSDFIFLTLEYTDHQGHNSGFGIRNPKYISAFRDAEATGMDFIEAIKARPTYDSEDWLILMTTDHGGLDKEHGGPSFEERITYIVSNKGIEIGQAD